MSQQMPIALAKDRPDPAIRSLNLFRSILITIRPHQWIKNVFIFAPLLFARRLTDASAIGNSVLAFFVFCCLASGLYIFNDILDADEDRAHPKKRFRPISSGALPLAPAAAASIFLIAAGGLIAFSINVNVFLIAIGYFLITLAYCLALKKMILLDGMTIAAGFVLRIVGGAQAINVVSTHWLIVCAFLLALFLAFTKRRQELLIMDGNASDHRKVLEQYSVSYLDQINNILIGAAIVCYALYTVAPETVSKFDTTALIYGTVFVIYGMLRYLVLIKKPENGGNPSRMLFRDTSLLITVSGWAAYNAIVVYHSYLAGLWHIAF
jgi:4-hydroxybenzoate polyprenyltransferase